MDIDVNQLANSLNNRADRDLNNLSQSGKENITGLCMPSNRYINLELGPSNTQYTAPANGFYFIAPGGMTNGQYFKASCLDPSTKSEIYAVKTTRPYTNSDQDMLIPIKGGNILKVEYTTTSIRAFRFIYAEGA